MDLSPWNIGANRKTLVVLGAGASYGEQLWGAGDHTRPPLDRTFFSELQKLPSTEHVEPLLEFAQSEFGSTVGLSMEEFFSYIDYNNKFHHLFHRRGRRTNRYSRALEKFHDAIPLVFRSCLMGRTFNLHSMLVDKLRIDDAIISFNYDCIVDSSLRDANHGYWSPARGGYGFSTQGGEENWVKQQRRKAFSRSLLLLKPHGSLNWNISRDRRVLLEAEPYKILSAAGRIIPPTWLKVLDDEPFRSVWKTARTSLRTCKALISIGYSVPRTDLFSRALFQGETTSRTARSKLDLVVTVNPDATSRHRFLDLIRSGIAAKTRIFEYDSFKAFIDAMNLAATS